MRLFVPLVLLLLTGMTAAGARAQVVVEGRLVGDDGTPMPLAHVTTEQQRRALAVQTVAPDGRYRVVLEAPGLYHLRFAGALHEAHPVAVLAAASDTLTLNVQLTRQWMDADQSYTRVVGSFNGFDYETGVPLAAVDAHTYVAIVPTTGDSLAYDLPGATSQNRADGLELAHLPADAWRYRAGQGYRPVLAATGDSARVTMTLRPARGAEPVVDFPGRPRAADVAALVPRLSRFSRPRGAVRADGARAVLGGRSAEDEDRAAALAAEAAEAADAWTRRLRLFEYLNRVGGPFLVHTGAYHGAGLSFDTIGEADPAVLAQVLDEIPPDDGLWTLQPLLVQLLVEQTDYAPAAVAYAEDAARRHPDVDVRKTVAYNLVDGLYARQGRSDAVRAYAAAYLETFGAEDDLGEAVAALLQEGETLRAGRRAPEWPYLRTVEGEALSLEAYRGRPVVLDFYRPGTGAADPEGLSTLRARYGDAVGLVRIALVHGAAVPAAEGSHTTAVARGGYRSPVATVYGVSEVPYRVVIDADRVLVAAGPQLTGERLVQRLDEVVR